MYILKFLVFVLCFFVFSQINKYATTKPSSEDSQKALKITQIESLSQISESPSSQTVYFFDIDDTLFDSAAMLGSKAWRKYIYEATKNDLTQNWHDQFSLFVAQKYPLKAVEEKTSQFVKELQAKGHAVYCLTARERNRWYDMPMEGVDSLTIHQLQSVGIHLDVETLNGLYPHMTQTPEYYQGVFFADIEQKGEYLLKLLKESAQLPGKIVFIDDKKNQVESVAAALEQLGINYECYWYTPTDKKAAQFDPLIANIQLYYLCLSNGSKIISDEEAVSIADQYIEINEEDYLGFLLMNFKHESQ